MKIPRSAIPYIMYQRTNYLSVASWPFFRLLPYKLIVLLGSVFWGDSIRRRYTKDIENEYTSIKNYLPNKIDNFMDIGFGMGGIDVKIYQMNKPNHMYLIDKDRTENRVWYGFSKDGAAYNSIKTSKEFFNLNGIPESEYDIINIEEYPFPAISCNLIVSLISLGFHYPIETYLKGIRENLTSDGVLIVDIRKGTNGRIILEKEFSSVEVIVDSIKSWRLVCAGVKKYE